MGDYIKVVHVTSPAISIPSLKSQGIEFQLDIPAGYTAIGAISTGVGTTVGLTLQAIDVGFVRIFNTTSAAAACAPTQNILCIKTTPAES